MIDLCIHPIPKNNEIVCIRIGGVTPSFDYSWIEQKGEILLKIPCVDGMFLLARIPWLDEDPKDRHTLGEKTPNMLD